MFTIFKYTIILLNKIGSNKIFTYFYMGFFVFGFIFIAGIPVILYTVLWFAIFFAIPGAIVYNASSIIKDPKQYSWKEFNLLKSKEQQPWFLRGFFSLVFIGSYIFSIFKWFNVKKDIDILYSAIELTMALAPIVNIFYAKDTWISIGMIIINSYSENWGWKWMG